MSPRLRAILRNCCKYYIICYVFICTWNRCCKLKKLFDSSLFHTELDGQWRLETITKIVQCDAIEYNKASIMPLPHWGRVTHICVDNLTIIASDNDLSPDWHHAIIWTSAGISLIGPLGENFSEILFAITIYTFSVKIKHLKMLSGNWRPFCPGLNV